MGNYRSICGRYWYAWNNIDKSYTVMHYHKSQEKAFNYWQDLIFTDSGFKKQYWSLQVKIGKIKYIKSVKGMRALLVRKLEINKNHPYRNNILQCIDQYDEILKNG